MSRNALALGLLLLAGSAWAQTPAAPAAGSGGGGGVGTSQTTPTSPTGRTPPGTPSANSAPDQISRDSTGQQVIGHTVTPPSAVPGNTGGPETGAK